MTDPPHDDAAEVAVLGAVMLSSTALDDIGDSLRPGDFYVPAHGVIFGTMLAMSARGLPVDGTTLRAELVRTGEHRACGGDERLSSLTDAIPVIGNVTAHAAIVRRLSVRRAVLDAAREVTALAHGDMLDDDFAAAVDSTVAGALARGIVRRAKPITEVAHTWASAVTAATIVRPGIPCGLSALDDLLRGFRRGEVYVLAGRPAMGKSALASAIVEGVAEGSGLTCLVHSLEMSEEQWFVRQVAARSGVSGTRLRDLQIARDEHDAVLGAVSEIASLPIYIDDAPGVTLTKVRSEARRLRARGPLGIVAVDYMQLMSGRDRESREQVVSEISRGLKALAKECNVPVLALSQLNRELEKRADKRPMLADLRESGAIEQDADVVMFVYRDEVYNRESMDKGVAELIIGKHRGGACGTIRLKWDAHLTRFATLEET